MNGPRLKVITENPLGLMAEVENEVLTRYKLDISDYTAKLEALNVDTKELNATVTTGQKNIQNAANASAMAIQKTAQSTQAYAAQMQKGVTEATKLWGDNAKAAGVVNQQIDQTTEKAKTLKQQYREALLEAQKGNKAAAEQAALLKDQIDDTNESVRELASGSKFEQFSNSLGAVGGKLANLDFEGAAEKSEQLADVASKITFKEGIEGVKNFGTSILNVGKAILGNPIFLIAGAVIGITAAIYQWITSESELEKQIREGREALEERARVDQKEYDIAVTLAKARGASEAELNRISDDNLKKQIERTKEKLRLDTLEVQSKIDGQKIIEGVFGKDAAAKFENAKEIAEAEKALQATRDEIDKLDANLRASQIKGIFDVTKAVVDGANKQIEAGTKANEKSKQFAADQKKRDEDRKKRLEDERKAEEAHEAELLKLGEESNKERERQSSEISSIIIGQQEEQAQLREYDQNSEYEALIKSNEFLKGSLDDRQKLIDEAYEAGRISHEQDVEASKAIEEQRQAVYLESARVGLNALVSIFDTAAQLEGEGSQFAKVAALFRIGIDTAKALSATIAGATAAAAAAGPAAPFVLGGYIASGIATVFGAYAQVKQLLDKEPPHPPKSNVQRFAEGTSYVEGGQWGVDSVDAVLMPGERVVKTKDNLAYWDALEDISRGTFDQNYMHISDLVPSIGSAMNESKSMQEETHAYMVAKGLVGSGKWRGENIAKALNKMDNNESIRAEKTIKAIKETKKISLRKQ